MTTDVIEVYAPRPVIEVVHAEPFGQLVVEDTIVQVIEVVTPGPQGPQGQTGATGATGQTGPSPTFEQHFAVASDTWVIIHPLNAYPEVTTVDLNGMEFVGDVMFPDKNTVVVHFAMPLTGTARLKA